MTLQVALGSAAGEGVRGGGGLLVAGIVIAVLADAIAATALGLGRGDMMGDVHATPDEFAWLDTAYVAMKLMGFIAAPWLLTRFAPRRLLILSILAVGCACAYAALTTALGTQLLVRIVQGFVGGVLLVAAQALLFLWYPRARQPIVQALFAMGSVAAPAMFAPALQGWLIDSLSWKWVFLASVPLATAGAGLVLMSDADPPLPRSPTRFDWSGFALLAVGFGCVTYLCVQGNRWNWFEEPRIAWITLTAAVALITFVAHQRLSLDRRLIDWSVLRTGDFAFAFAVSFVAGSVLSGSAWMISAFTVSALFFTPAGVGQLLLPGGVLFAATLLLAAFLMQARGVPPIATVPFGIALILGALWMLSGSTSQSGADALMPALLLRGFGLGLLFLSITLIAFGSLARAAVASGIGLFNVGRQVGGLLGIAALQTHIDRQVVGVEAVLVASISGGAPAVVERISGTAALLFERDVDEGEAIQASTLLLKRAITHQASVIAFDTAFIALGLLLLTAIPLLIALRVAISRAGSLKTIVEK